METGPRLVYQKNSSSKNFKMRQKERNSLIKQIANVIDQLPAEHSEHQEKAKAALAQAIAAIGEMKVEEEEMLPAWKIIKPLS